MPLPGRRAGPHAGDGRLREGVRRAFVAHEAPGADGLGRLGGLAGLREPGDLRMLATERVAVPGGAVDQLEEVVEGDEHAGRVTGVRTGR